MKQPQIKICGLTSIEEAAYLNENQVDYAGFVLFYPKSKRNTELKTAITIMAALHENIKKVAVTVSPTGEQIHQIEEAEFDFLQVHGDLEESLLETISIPVLRAFNIDKTTQFKDISQIAGYVVDGKIPGGGEPFEWSLVKKMNRNGKLFVLAGGLHKDNVLDGICYLEPDVVDVSSGVEHESGIGKDPDKIRAFVETVRMGNYH